MSRLSGFARVKKTVERYRWLRLGKIEAEGPTENRCGELGSLVK